MSEKQTVTFTEAVQIESQGKVEFKAAEGEVMHLPPASAARWLRRGKCVEGKVEQVVTALDEAHAGVSAATERLTAAEAANDTKEIRHAKNNLAKKNKTLAALENSD